MVKVVDGALCGQIGLIHEIVLDANFTPLIYVKMLADDCVSFVTRGFVRGALELLPSNSEAIVAYIRMSTAEPLRAVA